jgi:hypothetical protein
MKFFQRKDAKIQCGREKPELKFLRTTGSPLPFPHVKIIFQLTHGREDVPGGTGATKSFFPVRAGFLAQDRFSCRHLHADIFHQSDALVNAHRPPKTPDCDEKRHFNNALKPAFTSRDKL